MSFKKFELAPSQARTASGATDWFVAETITMAMVGIDITAASGTIAFDLWLEGTDDDGTTSYELVADQVLQTNGAAASATVNTNVRDIVDNKTTTAAAKFSAIYKHLPTGKVRLAWLLTGTTPSVTFSGSLHGK